MSIIKSITANKYLNSRGEWTVGTRVVLDDGAIGFHVVPDGASKGENEASYIPVDLALESIRTKIDPALNGFSGFDQKGLDDKLLELDGTADRSNIGANAILSTSLAYTKACAKSKHVELYEYLRELFGGDGKYAFPTPVFNILNGGKHAHNGLSFQEFMVIPARNMPYDKAVQLGVDVYHELKSSLKDAGFDIDVGDEGGFAPNNFDAKKALTFLRNAASEHYSPGANVFFGMDVAAGSFYADERYVIPEQNLTLNGTQLGDYYENLLREFEIIFLEDPFYEKDPLSWESFTNKMSSKLMIVADDLVVTNTKLLEDALSQRLANAVIVKPNQVGTLTETFSFIKKAKEHEMAVCVSHRSGDTAEDTFISDLALAVGADFMKSGAPARGERTAKYNRLLDIFYTITS
ncbi:MAG: phosphopyruvate hydratase [Patescibacteria group bacterium]|jgi:enolase